MLCLLYTIYITYILRAFTIVFTLICFIKPLHRYRVRTISSPYTGVQHVVSEGFFEYTGKFLTY